MDPNMDATIDPEIGAQSGIFTKFSLESDLSPQHHHNNADDAQGTATAALLAHQNNFNFTGDHIHVNDHHGHDSTEAAAAAAAANLSSIINFNQMEQDSTEASSSDQLDQQHHIAHSGNHRDPKQSQLSFLNTTLSARVPQQQDIKSMDPALQPKQRLIKDPSSKVSIVVVNPAQKEGTGRLGRPRRPLDPNSEKVTKSLMETSSNNKEECLVSKFRVDSRPVVGPGSRGGTSHLKITPKKSTPIPTQGKFVAFTPDSTDIKVARTQAPATSPSAPARDQDESNVSADIPAVEGDTDVRIISPEEGNTTAEADEDDGDVMITGENITLDSTVPSSADQLDDSRPTPPLTNSFILEDYESLKAKGRSVHKDKQDVFAKLGLVPLMPKKSIAAPEVEPLPTPEKKPITRPRKSYKPVITVARGLKRKDIPGPITPMYWDLYDPELLKLGEQKKHQSQSKPPSTQAASAGTQDDEPVIVAERKDTEMVALGYQVKPAPFATDIMMIMSFILKFKKLLKGIPNLGPHDFEEGLKLTGATPYPVENANQVEATLIHNGDEVSEDINHLFRCLLMLLLNRKKEIPKSGVTKALYDLKAEVLEFGLPAEWRDDTAVYNGPSMDESLKNPVDEEPVDPENNEFIDTILYNFDTTKPLDHTPLDNDDFETRGLDSLEPKDRLILLRSMVCWCCTHSEAVRREINAQVSRQDSSGEKETYYLSRFVRDGADGVEAANSSLKLHPRKKIKKSDDADTTVDAYTDASVNPLDHHMSFRLLDFYAGDGGVAGRFFLCRSADNTSGGYASVSEMKALWQSEKSVNDMIGDVQPSRFKLYVEDVTTMLRSILEVETSLSPDGKETLDPWYEIAGNVSELSGFVEYLGTKLQFISSKKLSNLHNYLKSMLPPLQKFETIYTEFTSQVLSRESRKRGQVTDLKEQDRQLRKMIKQSESPENEFLRDDSDEEMADEDEDFGLETGEPDDAEDDDYRD